MRILAIRGRNLASLAGDFAIEFETGPLADAGIFAITGPTGAGKSTLLDAVCLALFNDIPRLRTAPSSGKIGGEDEDSGLSLKDSRAILRHGTGDGFAEVDFAMPDGKRYRARWSVKRARGKADGRLQKVEHSFERLDNAERLGGTLTETLTAIRAVIGLTVEQFGRAVLLAQGDFDAFIRADANERAVLLERLTGSEIYARLGQQAFEKAQALKSALDAIRQQIAAQNGLDDSQRTAAEAQLAAAQADEAAVLAHCAALATARQWEERSAALTALIAAARDELATAQSACETATPRRTALDRDRKAFALTPLWTALTSAQTARDNAACQVIKGEQAATAATAEEQRTHQLAEAAGAAHRTQTDHAAALAPTLAAARALDLHLTTATRARNDAHSEAQSRQTASRAAETTHQQAQTAHQTATSALATHTDWLAANPALAPLAIREPELAAQLTELATESARITTAETVRAEQEVAQTKALAAWNAAKAALESATAHHESTQRALTAARAALPPESRLLELTKARDRLAHVEALLTAYNAAEDALTVADHALAVLRGKQRDLDERSDAATARQLALQATLPALTARLGEAQRTLDLLTAAASETAEGLRASLQPGEPCPVCGSAEHQLSVFEGKLGDALRTRREAVAALANEHAATQQAATKAQTERDLLADQSARAKRDIAEHAQNVADQAGKRDQARATLATAAHAADLPESSEALPEALSAHRTATDTELATLQSARTAATKASAAEELARTALDKARSDHEAARDALSTYSRALDETTATLTRRGEKAEALARTLDRWLAPVEPGWRTQPQPAHWLATQAAIWREHEAARHDLAAELPALRDALTKAAAALTTAQDRAREAAEALQSAADAHTKLAAERAALLDGEPVGTVEHRLAIARETAEAQLQRTTEAHTNAEKAQAAAEASLIVLRGQFQQFEATLSNAEAAFARALTDAALTREDVNRVADAGEAALQAETAALAKIDKARDDAAVLLHQRETDLTRHEASERPALTGPDLAAAITAAEADRATIAAVRSEADVKLRMDDNVRARTAALRAELETASAKADVWLRLATLIGDAKGANFRRFAQGLTLDRLLEHANARLSDLKPRYTLQRGAGGRHADRSGRQRHGRASARIAQPFGRRTLPGQPRARARPGRNVHRQRRQDRNPVHRRRLRRA